MGVCQSQEDKELQSKTKAIDKELMQGHMAQQKVVKLLLLGAGECGKSTVLKQMRILHDHGFSEDEMQKQKAVCYNNTVQAMAQILRGMNQLNIPFSNPNHESDARFVLDTIKRGEESDPFTEELTRSLLNLWKDKAVSQVAVSRGNEFQLVESATHFLDSIERVASADYKPTEQDILLSRIKTTGIVEVKFKMKNVDFRVFDVGGQRSERKKWIHCFEDVNAIIFIAAISEYDQVLFEDEQRMVESMRLFESICNSRWFINTSMILFLNKKDLFLEKIKRISIKIAFSDYKGPNTYDDQVKYIEEKFEGLNANPDKTIYIHQTCATDTNQVQMILDSVIDMIIQANLQGCAMFNPKAYYFTLLIFCTLLLCHITNGQTVNKVSPCLENCLVPMVCDILDTAAKCSQKCGPQDQSHFFQYTTFYRIHCIEMEEALEDHLDCLKEASYKADVHCRGKCTQKTDDNKLAKEERQRNVCKSVECSTVCYYKEFTHSCPCSSDLLLKINERLADEMKRLLLQSAYDRLDPQCQRIHNSKYMKNRLLESTSKK
uniref:Chondroitin proteoglycan 4 domain-containing protein n=1 Tax=Ditylenchus dipsaci TaxID=166011 RepID=A0A915E609_9BILA